MSSLLNSDLYNVPFPDAALMIADPIYSDYETYNYLAGMTKSIKNIFLFTNSLHLIPCCVASPNLQNARVLTVHKQTHGGLSGNTIEKAYHVLWVGEKSTISNKHKLPDSWISNTWAGDYPTTHKWTKNPEFIGMLIKNTTHPNELVIDPCMGNGLVPYMAKRLGRQYIGTEIEHGSFIKAKEVVSQAQEMMFL